MLRWWRIFSAFTVIGACGIASIPQDIHGSGRAILGTRPSYGPAALSAVPNRAAMDRLLWVPGLDEGWNPQGLAVAEGSVLISAYRSDYFGVNRGPCRVFRIDSASGRVTGHLDVPSPCGHAGGLAYAHGTKLYIADTHTLFEVDLASAFADPVPAFRRFPLGPGLRGGLAASGRGAIWVGTYEEGRPGRIFRFDCRVLEDLAEGAVLTQDLASAVLPIPSYAQGAALPASKKLWVSRSEIGWGALEVLDIGHDRTRQLYSVAAGIEGMAFDEAGRLWAVSEAGAFHNRWISPFFPVIFRLDTSRLQSPR